MKYVSIIQNAWTLPADTVVERLESSRNGISEQEAAQRLLQFGLNQIVSHAKSSIISIFLSQFKSWLVVLLIGAALISFFLGEKIDAAVVLGIVFLSVFFSFIQEYKAQHSLSKLIKLITSKTKVLRDGNWIEVHSTKLTPGDIVQLHIGDKVTADIRLIDTDGLTVDESILTGESKPVIKTTDRIASEHAQMYQQTNMVFSGSFIASGTGTGIVVAVAEYTYIGKTSKALSSAELPTDFQKQIDGFSAFLFKVVVILTLFVFGANALLQKGVFSSFLFAVALAVGITPELLPMIITVTLSSGALKMAKKKVIVKKLSAVEDLGNIDTLCCDKTGTLTEGTVVLSEYQNMDGKKDEELLKAALICTNSFDSRGKTSIDPIEKALWTYQHVHYPHMQFEGYQITDENEFDFTRRMMSVVVKSGDGFVLYAKGSPDSIIERSSASVLHSETQKLTPEDKQKLHKTIHEYQLKGSRVLMLAKKIVTHDKSNTTDEIDLSLTGMLLFSDPVKKSVRDALVRFSRLGVGIKLMSGDAPEIVSHVASETGLSTHKDRVILGSQLDALTDSELEKIVNGHALFARVTPVQKYKLIESLNKTGHIVGFLGDGINDAPALKAADVGIAVDTGAEIAKDAADLVLLDKDLHSVAYGIEQGRKTFGNITKYILNTISANYGNMATVALSSLFLPFIPLLPKQILLNNFISDIPLTSLSTDRVDPKFMKKPKRWDIKLLTRFMIFFGLISSLFDFATILPLIFIFKAPPDVFRTVWFIESSLSEIIVTFAIRTHLPFYRSRPSSWLIGLSVVSIIIVIGISQLSIGHSVFEFTGLTFPLWIFIAFVLVSYFCVTEIAKHFFFRRFDPDSS